MKYLLFLVLLSVVGCTTVDYKPLCHQTCEGHKGLKHLMACSYDEMAVCECKDGTLQKVQAPTPPDDHGHPDHDFPFRTPNPTYPND